MNSVFRPFIRTAASVFFAATLVVLSAARGHAANVLLNPLEFDNLLGVPTTFSTVVPGTLTFTLSLNAFDAKNDPALIFGSFEVQVVNAGNTTISDVRFNGTNSTPTFSSSDARSPDPIEPGYLPNSAVWSLAILPGDLNDLVITTFVLGLGSFDDDTFPNARNATLLADFVPSPVTSDTPLPPALPLFASGAGFIGMLAWKRRRRTAVAV